MTFSWGVALTRRASGSPRRCCARPTWPSTGPSAAAAAACARLRARWRARGAAAGRAHPRPGSLAARLVDSALEWLDGPGRRAPGRHARAGGRRVRGRGAGRLAWSVSEERSATPARSARRRTPTGVWARGRACRPARGVRARRLPADAGHRARRRRFHVDVEDPAADAAEASCCGARAAAQLLAGGRRPGHLVELFGDDATPPMGWAAAPLRLLVREAASSAAPSA